MNAERTKLVADMNEKAEKLTGKMLNKRTIDYLKVLESEIDEKDFDLFIMTLQLHMSLGILALKREK